MLPQPAILAQESDYPSLFFWLVVVIGLTVIGYLAFAALRRWLRAPEDPGSGNFSLSDLRQLHRDGHMTDIEYEKARGRLVASTKAQYMPPKKPKDEVGS